MVVVVVMRVLSGEQVAIISDFGTRRADSIVYGGGVTTSSLAM